MLQSIMDNDEAFVNLQYVKYIATSDAFLGFLHDEVPHTQIALEPGSRRGDEIIYIGW